MPEMFKREPLLWKPVEIRVAVESDQEEQLGSKSKFWTTEDETGVRWLAKYARRDRSGTRGEDWAEWVSQFLADELGVPHAEIRPALIDGQRGILSRDVRRHGSQQRLVMGNELLVEHDVMYDTEATRENPNYTVELVRKSLEAVGQPISFAGDEALSGFDVWAGYLVFDAWIAGRDRHHENWAILRTHEGRTLAPSYDHGNALGFQESDHKRQQCIDHEDEMETWASRGRSHHFAGRPVLTELASSALAVASVDARSCWRDRLNGIQWPRVDEVVDAVPRDVMSEVAATFVKRLLRTNARRMLDAYPRN